jgi:hypothetical protein
MVLMKDELIAALTDIEAIIIECSGCKSQVKIPIGATIGNPGDLRGVPPLSQCPVCTVPFESTLVDCVKKFKDNLSPYGGIDMERISLLLKSAEE